MSLRVVIFGAHGPTGQFLTEQALKRGYLVTAVTRRPEQFGQQDEHLQVVRGDVYDPASIAATIVGQDAVLSVVGVPYSWKEITTYAQSARAIVDGMRGAGVARLICTSSGGTHPGYDPAEGFFFGRILKPTLGRSTYTDMRKLEAIVIGSDLDWTIVRPGQLVSHPSVTRYHVQEGFFVPGKHRTGRADVADFMLNQLTNPKYLRKGAAIASDM